MVHYCTRYYYRLITDKRAPFEFRACSTTEWLPLVCFEIFYKLIWLLLPQFGISFHLFQGCQQFCDARLKLAVPVLETGLRIQIVLKVKFRMNKTDKAQFQQLCLVCCLSSGSQVLMAEICESPLFQSTPSADQLCLCRWLFRKWGSFC
jgi:hypothetical protein